MSKVKVPGGAFYAGEGLNVDPITRTVSAGGAVLNPTGIKVMKLLVII